MPNPYSIDFAPLNLGGLSEVADVYQRAAMNRDVNDLKRRELDLREKTLSAEEYRKTEEFKAAQEERARKKEIDKIAAYDPALRLARQSPELATSLYKSPYGFSFFKSPDLGPGEEGPQLSPAAPVDRPAHPLGMRGEMAAVSQLGDQVDAISGGAAVPQSPPPPSVEPAPPGPTPQTRLYADLGTGPTETPAAPSSPTGYGPKYDAIYEAALAQGAKPFDAFKVAQEDYQKDTTATAIAERQRLDDARGTASRLEHERFLASQSERYRQTAAEQSRIDMARIAAMMSANQNRLGESAGTMQILSKYATENPGDSEGLYRLAGTLGAVNPQAAVSQVDKLTTPTESEAKNARQAAIGLRAIDEIQSGGYTPKRDEIQKWLNNQRQVYQAQKAGEGGGIGGLLGGAVAGVAQGTGLMAQSETEDLPPKAQEYFANVRRFMETIGRAQSGAAISPSEWTNFFNQYGPQSKGGIEAAKRYLNDQLRTSGAAGRQLEASGGVPAAKKPPRSAAPATIPSGAETIPGKVGPHGRPVFRLNGKLYEQD